MDDSVDRFVARLARFDPHALVRLRPAGPGLVAVWGVLPWGVLVTRTATGVTSTDRTVAAADLLAGVEKPRVRDSEWRWALPPAAAVPVEVLPAQVVRDVARAAAETLREATTAGVRGKSVGSRRLRDALLDHVAITVTVDAVESPWRGRVVDIPQRVVQAVTRMGLLAAELAAPAARDTGATADAPEDGVEVVVAGPWIGLATTVGTAWYRPSAPSLRPL
jgi:hypothetical protein